jgi:hypothetical protein
MKKPLIFFSILLACSLIVTQVYADKLESESYVITFGNFNITSGEKDSATYHVTDTVGQTGAGPYGTFGSTDYFVGGGFQYIYQIPEFSFSLSAIQIDLGVLTPGSHSNANHTATVNTKGAGGYTVYAYEIQALTHSNGSNFISDTTCDLGGCSETTAAVWTNQNIPGFGFNASGDDVVPEFTDSTYYKQFANDQSAETMQAIMTSDTIATSRTATITYKAGIAGDQAAGSYETGVIYVAVPGY